MRRHRDTGEGFRQNLELTARSRDGLDFSIAVESIEIGIRQGSSYRGIAQTSPSKQFKGSIRYVGSERVSWKKMVRGLRESPFRTRVGENDWKIAKSLGYLSLNLDIDVDLHPEFRFKDTDGVGQMLLEAVQRTVAVRKWWEFWQ
jgi:hypothetical protein